MKCSKCNTTERLSQHHIFPVTFFGGKRTGLKICLCQTHHREIENRILVVESTVGNVSYGTRYPLERSYYERITRHYLKTTNIIYMAV